MPNADLDDGGMNATIVLREIYRTWLRRIIFVWNKDILPSSDRIATALTTLARMAVMVCCLRYGNEWWLAWEMMSLIMNKGIL